MWQICVCAVADKCSKPSCLIFSRVAEIAGEWVAVFVVSYKRDGGRPAEVGHQVTGFKPPHAAVIKSNGRERCG